MRKAHGSAPLIALFGKRQRMGVTHHRCQFTEDNMADQDQEAIRLRAYQIWESKGRPEGEHESHWEQALKELGLVEPYDTGPASPRASSWDEEEE